MKKYKSVKGLKVYNEKPTREWLLVVDAASPDAPLKIITMTEIFYSKGYCDVMTQNVTNYFIYMEFPKAK